METIQAIYENGVFRPVAPVTLPEQTRVTVIPEAKMEGAIGSNSDGLYALLEERFESGITDGAARVDEIDP
jgi:predicted DNA-binding antitoxin AbrB/MazE fold protein